MNPSQLQDSPVYNPSNPEPGLSFFFIHCTGGVLQEVKQEGCRVNVYRAFKLAGPRDTAVERGVVGLLSSGGSSRKREQRGSWSFVNLIRGVRHPYL